MSAQKRDTNSVACLNSIIVTLTHWITAMANLEASVLVCQGIYCFCSQGADWMFFVVFFFLSSTGYRSVPLKNGYSENLELASLLVHISILQAGVRKHGTHHCWFTSICSLTHQHVDMSVVVITWPLSFRKQRRSCTHPPASWRKSSLSSAVNLSCMTHTPTFSAPPSLANTTTSRESSAPVRNTG